uniref:fimbrial tip adhesin FimD n=1 Tax=Segatella copri TaxID=165179 RepID=UPI004024DE9F
MKTLNIYKNTTLALMALTMGLSLVGCAEDSELIYQGAQQLSVKPLILDNKVSRATTASEASLNEDKLYNFNIKMFGEYNECKVDKTFTGGLKSGEEKVIAQNNWKVDNDLQEGNTYSVKSVANATGSGDVQTDVDIWKPYDATSNSNKMFLMSSEQNYPVTKEPTQTIPVNLARAAAKIALTIHVDVEGYTAGQAKWQLKNYNAKTTIFGSNTETELKDGEMVEAQGASGEYTVTTYSYATQWNDDTKAPAIYLQVPLTADGKTEMNYYKIPVRDPKATGEDAKKLNRNTIYTIDAKINNKGGSSEIGYITAGKVVYDVLPWSDGGTTDIDANTSYLMVTPKVVYMKNVDEDMSVTYKSSSPVTIVSKKVYYIDNEGNTEVYSEGYKETFYETVTYTTTEKVWVRDGLFSGHYEDREVEKTEKKDVPFYPYPTKMELQNEKDGDNLGGKIVINSPIPKNRFSKYIVLTLKNAEGKEATVKYKQSPLIETQNFFGDYSSRSKNGWVYRKPNGERVTRGLTPSDYEGGYLAKYYDAGSGNIYSFEYGSSYNLSLTNNRMYIIQVSSTKDSKYNIAHPNIDKTTGYTNDEVVSPAFMIASQLGAVQSGTFNQTTAKTHCETYREVKKENGKQVKYDGWRLPTKTEIQFIVNFQKESFKRNDNTEIKPIKPVLEGAKYYTLNNKSVETGYSGSGTYVRCVRDLTPAEVEELDKQMK